MSEKSRDSVGSFKCLHCLLAVKMITNSAREEQEPPVKMFAPDCQVHMLLKGISLVRTVTEQQRTPEIIHGRQVSRPVYMGKNRGEQIILAYLFVKQIDQSLYIAPVLNVGFGVGQWTTSSYRGAATRRRSHRSLRLMQER